MPSLGERRWLRWGAEMRHPSGRRKLRSQGDSIRECIPTVWHPCPVSSLDLFQISLEEYDENWNLKENKALEQWYEANRPGIPDIGYIIRLVPLEVEPPLPRLVPEIGWCGEFDFRPH